MVERSAVMAQALSRHRFTVDEYHRIIRAGVLAEDDRVELLHGEFVTMPPIDVPHAYCVDQLLNLFSPLIPKARLRIQNPITLPTESEPEPDFVLAKPCARGYSDRHPHPRDILLVVEVANTSQVADRGVKVPLYAKHGIPEYWIVDLVAGRVEVYREPDEGAFTTMRSAGSGEILTPLAFPEHEVRVDDLLP